MLGGLVLLHLLVGHLLVLDGLLILLVEAVVFGEDFFDHDAHGAKHILEHILGTLSLFFPAVGHVKLLGGQLAEDIPGLAAGNGTHDLVPQGKVVVGHGLQNKGGPVRIDAVGDDHVQADVIAVDGFKEQVVPAATVPAGLLEDHLKVLQLGVEGVPVVDKRQENVG